MSKSLKALPRLSTSAQVAKAEISSPKFGVSWLGWSPEGNLLAMREESQPRCLWVWHALEAQLCALLVQMDSVVCARWRPTLIQEGNESNSGKVGYIRVFLSKHSNLSMHARCVNPCLGICMQYSSSLLLDPYKIFLG